MSYIAFCLLAIASSVSLAQGPLTLPIQSPIREDALAQPSTTPEWEIAAGRKTSFEVASIRPTKPGEFAPPNFGLSSQDKSVPPGGLFIADFPLSIYIDFAYKLRLSSSQEVAMLSRLPKWVNSDNYEIRARAPANATKDQVRLMMQSLLSERFKLAAHFERQEIPVLVLTLIKPGKTGPSLRPHPENLTCSKRDDPFPPVCDIDTMIPKANHMILMGSRNITLNSLAASLGAYQGLDRPVVDRTALSGRYDYAIEWTEGADAETELQGTTFLEAVHEQLGLKLERSTAPLDVLVIDHVERPSPN